MKRSRFAPFKRLGSAMRGLLSSSRSLRLRMGGSLAIALALVMSVMTAVSVVDVRRQYIETERTHAIALLDHLGQMSALREGETSARRELAAFAHYLRGAGIRVDLLTLPTSAGSSSMTAVAERMVRVGESPFLLRYSVTNTRLRSTLWRSVLLHVVYGAIAILATLAIAEWMLRRHVFSPLAMVERQLHHVGAGHGWLTLVPETDRELDGLASSVRTLGPSLERQVWEWIEADRRANGELLMSRLRGRAARSLVAIRATVEEVDREGLRADLTDRLRSEIEALATSLSEDGASAGEAEQTGSRGRRTLRGSGR